MTTTQTDEMEFGTILWTMGENANPATLRRIAETAEETGFDFLACGEHIAFPESFPDRYPFSRDGKVPDHYDISEDVYTQTEVLAFLVAITDRISFATNMCVAPLHHPTAITKRLFTLDALSEGRLEVGASVGWLASEHEALDVPFEERGSRLDEFLELFTRACRESEFAFDGPHHTFDRLGFYPRPVREDGPPIWIGGKSGAALRRAAEFGTGVVVVWDRPEQVRELRDRLDRAWADFDREGEPDIAVMRPIHLGTDTDLDTDRVFVGEPESVIEDIEAYREAGATRIFHEFYTGDPNEQVEALTRFSDEVIPAF